jgi:hypothetical protein
LKRHEYKSELAKQSQRENFDRLLLDAIDETLSSLGEDAKASIYIHLEGLFKIRKEHWGQHRLRLILDQEDDGCLWLEN